MINTFFGLDALASPAASAAAFLIGIAFGFALEQAGFGSSRRLAGIFYFRDMTVLKVMFTALTVAMIGLLYCLFTGIISEDQLYLMPTVWGPQVIGGLIFGVGFVMGGWCPGTAAVGLASGKLDAFLFLLGAIGGSVIFNEVFGWVAPLYHWGDTGVHFIWQDLGLSPAAFAVVLTAAAVMCFWGSEWIERRVTGSGPRLRGPVLKSLTIAILSLAVGLVILGGRSAATQRADIGRQGIGSETGLLAAIEVGEDHVEPEDLARRLLSGDRSLVLVDIRTPAEFARFHIRGAINVSLTDLESVAGQHSTARQIVLYSNGMTHPAQARDALYRAGFRNVYLLTDGLEGFMERCLKPVSLRTTPVGENQASEINAWRNFFFESTEAQDVASAPSGVNVALPGLVETDWLAEHLGRNGVRVVDCRSQPAYNTAHIPGSVYLHPESFRGVVDGVSSMLLPINLLASHVSLMGIEASDTVVIVPSESIRDATLIAIGLERLGHVDYGILNGGFDRWKSEGKPTDTLLPSVEPSEHAVGPPADAFTVDYHKLLGFVNDRSALVLDVRPQENYDGTKSDEARAGHVPGAVNRPYTEDVMTEDGITKFRPVAELTTAYAALIPSRDTTVVVHCRTGHQASQAYFVLKILLGYRNVLWYDAGWSEWASRPELPVDNDGGLVIRSESGTAARDTVPALGF